jgi:hypothetical protein
MLVAVCRGSFWSQGALVSYATVESLSKKREQVVVRVPWGN